MPKPLGIELGLSGNAMTMRVSHPSRAEDRIYDAVQEAMCEGMTPQQFVRIARATH